MNSFIKKISSRKFWAMIIGVAVGAGTVFGIDGEEISTISGIVTACASLITYIVTEGKIDAAALASKIPGEETRVG